MNGTPQHASSLAPVPKVAAAGIAGAISVIVVWILSVWVDVPPEVASAFTAVLAFAGGYLRPDQATK